MHQDAPLSQRANAIAAALRARGVAPCTTALILGTGLGSVVDMLDDPLVVRYEDVHGMPRSTAPGHAGQFVHGRLGDHKVLAMQGRFHPYEGWKGQDILVPVYALRRLGIENLLITNASGALNPAYKPGDIVLIEDHLNLTGSNPLVGRNDDAIGVRFPDLSQVYWPPFLALAKSVAARLGYALPSGIYAGVLGPSLETPAERRLLRMTGADLVGMSTVYEVIAAAHCGMKVLALAAVTNMALGTPSARADSIEEVLANAQAASLPMSRLLASLVAEIESANDAQRLPPSG